MQALRERFQPEVRKLSPIQGDLDPRVISRDYFTFVPSSPTVKAPSLPSTTPKNATTPSAAAALFRGGAGSFTKIDGRTRPDDQRSIDKTPAQVTPAILSPDSTTRHSVNYLRRASAMRKQVAPGDLAISSISDAAGGSYYRPGVTPGLNRMQTWRAYPHTEAENSNGLNPGSHKPDESEDTFELREGVALSIAKSLGLAQAVMTSNIDRPSGAVSVSAMSTPNSPLFPAHSRAPRGAFGNVLDMMNASSRPDTLLDGMLREGLINSRMDDDMSSVSASVQESHVGPGSAEKSILRDLEGSLDILFYQAGSTLVKEGDTKSSAGIYYVIDGFLEVSLATHGTDERCPSQPTVRRMKGEPRQTEIGRGRPKGQLSPKAQVGRSGQQCRWRQRDQRRALRLFLTRPCSL
jgi:lysophospholipid hydrolase